MADLEKRVGEIVEASTSSFVAQCYELYRIPPLGSLVKTGGKAEETYGIVYHASTGSLEPGRRPIARGKDATSEEGIYSDNPQLTQLLSSEFSALIVGHRRNDKVYQYLPPSPAQIHGFVYSCSPEELREFGQSFDFLNILLNAQVPIATEELVAAALRCMGEAQDNTGAFLVSAGKELAVLLGGEFNRLKAILGRIK